MNAVRLRGTLKNVSFYYERKNETFLRGVLEIKRLSGTIDYIPIVMNDYLYDSSYDSCRVTVVGSFRSKRTKDSSGKSKLDLYVYCESIVSADRYLKDFNEIFLIGCIKSVPILRETPNGKEICDFTILANRNNTMRNDFIPCIAWYGNAEYLTCLRNGDKLQITGRIQSREYRKRVSEGKYEIRTAYEVSISRMEVVESEECKNQLADAE